MSELHNILPENVIFCYRDGDADSLEIANYYQVARAIPNTHLVALPCSSDNVITEALYFSTIEQPILDALATLSISSETGATATSAGTNEIWVIILGYNVPHAYESSSGDTIAVASRLHRVDHASQEKYSNFTYDRRGEWRFFGPLDASELYITAVIDAPTTDLAKALIDRSINVDNQTFVAGRIYLDPYGLKTTVDQLDFQADMLEFIGNSVNNLGLIVETTVDVDDPYDEPQVPFFREDSFYWGWYTPRYSRLLFLNQNQRRVFLYNADEDSAADIGAAFDVNGSDPWCNLAIGVDPGYACCAGAVSAPGEDAYLRPRPFFESLHRGSTIGEAFLYASPYVNWTIILIGDPLMVVNFPDELPAGLDPNDVSLPNNEVIRLVKEDIEEALAYAFRQSRLTQEIVDYNVQSNELIEQANLLYAVAQWRDLKSIDTRIDQFYRLVSSWLRYITTTTGLSLSQWLVDQNEMISAYLLETINKIASGTVSQNYVYPEGEWAYEFVYTHNRNTLENVHFRLQVATDVDFTNIEVGSIATEANSFEDTEGWQYENELYGFLQLIEFGLPSNFSGRTIRFTAPASVYLTRTEIYFVRWRALDSNGNNLTDWETDTSRFIIKR